MYGYAIAELGKRYDGEAVGDLDVVITGAASPNCAKRGDIICLADKAQLFQLTQTKASCVIVSKELAKACSLNKIIVKDPIAVFENMASLFQQHIHQLAVGVDARATLGLDVRLGRGVCIEPHAYVGDGVTLGNNVKIGVGAKIGRHVNIGDNSIIESGAIINHNVTVGRHVYIDSGAVIGAKPYHLIKQKGVWLEGVDRGSVVIQDNASIGANTTIDRGIYGDTLIGQGVKIDNLVQIGHDVMIGEHSTVIATAAIGANTKVGCHCIIGGGACIASQIKIHDNITVTAMAGVSKSLRREGIYSSGTTVQKHQIWRRNAARFHRLDLMMSKLRLLEHGMGKLKREILDE